MTNEHGERPRARTNAPAKPASTTEKAPAPRRDDPEERVPRREASDDYGVGGDRMPKGAGEPGAGL